MKIAACRQLDKPKETEAITMFNKVTLIGRLGPNAEAKTAQNNRASTSAPEHRNSRSVEKN